MKVKAEIAIDIDSNRRIWLTAEAEPVEPENIAVVSTALNESLADQALAIYEKARIKFEPEAAAIVAAAARRGEGSKRRPRPEDPESMRTFGPDDDEDIANAD